MELSRGSFINNTLGGGARISLLVRPKEVQLREVQLTKLQPKELKIARAEEDL